MGSLVGYIGWEADCRQVTDRQSGHNQVWKALGLGYRSFLQNETNSRRIEGAVLSKLPLAPPALGREQWAGLRSRGKTPEIGRAATGTRTPGMLTRAARS